MRLPTTRFGGSAEHAGEVAAGDDDRALALRARSDPAAFGLLLDRHVDGVYRCEVVKAEATPVSSPTR